MSPTTMICRIPRTQPEDGEVLSVLGPSDPTENEEEGAEHSKRWVPPGVPIVAVADVQKIDRGGDLRHHAARQPSPLDGRSWAWRSGRGTRDSRPALQASLHRTRALTKLKPPQIAIAVEGAWLWPNIVKGVGYSQAPAGSSESRALTLAHTGQRSLRLLSGGLIMLEDGERIEA